MLRGKLSHLIYSIFMEWWKAVPFMLVSTWDIACVFLHIHINDKVLQLRTYSINRKIHLYELAWHQSKLCTHSGTSCAMAQLTLSYLSDLTEIFEVYKF